MQVSFCGVSFTFLSMYFVEQYILFLMKFSSFLLFAFVLGIIFKNILPNTRSQRLLPIFSSKEFYSFSRLHLVSHFEFIVIAGRDKGQTLCGCLLVSLLLLFSYSAMSNSLTDPVDCNPQAPCQ